MNHTHKAFSLVELSIVLVILGLLVGGILAGQSLIRAAELRAVSTEEQRYATAVNAFRDKYMAIPGDMKNASSFWGLSTACAGAVATGACDGDGSGTLGQPAAASAAGEIFGFWRHLSLAGLVEGNYSGVAGSGAITHSILGTNIPSSKLAGSGWAVSSNANYAGDGSNYAYDYANHFFMGGTQTNSTPTAAILKPEEAWNIDTKMDDGMPGRGTVVARYWNAACANSTTFSDYTGTYRLSDTTLRCALIFARAF